MPLICYIHHIFQDTHGLSQEHIQIRHPSQNICKYTVQMGDERTLAPLSMFYPDMFGLVGSELVRNPERYYSDSTDPLDEDYLAQTMSKHEQVGRGPCPLNKWVGDYVQT